MPRSRRVDEETSEHGFSLSDVLCALFLIAWSALGSVAVVHDVADYRWQQQTRAEFDARTPKMIGEAPYDPAIGQRLIGEAAGCVLTIAAAVFWVCRRRRRGVEVSVKWIAAAPARSTAAQPARSQVAMSAPATPARAGPTRQATSGSLAAERLSVVVWNDHVARLEKEHA